MRRKARIRRKVRGTDARPRICVFRSNKHMYVQVISDESGRTMASVSTTKGAKAPGVEGAKALGSELAEKCKALSIQAAVFDRNGYEYHGRVRAVADSVREAGIRL